jgi:transglutaminase-like putative cysteine protease
MLFKIKHITHYEYSSKVFLEPHLLRVKPRTDANQTLKTFDLEVFPIPNAKNSKIGLNNHCDYMLWFEGNTNELKIMMTAVVEVENSNPFNFIIYPFTATQLPVPYTNAVLAELAPYLVSPTKDEKVKKLAKELMLDIDFQTLPFVTHVTQYLCKHFEQEKPNPYLPPASPEITLEKQAGSYKDLAFLQLTLLREAGIAARYVIGYYADPYLQPQSLHAWVEVYLPGAGWKGLDATTGMATGDRHIAINEAHIPTLCNLITGTYRGNASSNLSTVLEITTMNT